MELVFRSLKGKVEGGRDLGEEEERGEGRRVRRTMSGRVSECTYVSAAR